MKNYEINKEKVKSLKKTFRKACIGVSIFSAVMLPLSFEGAGRDVKAVEKQVAQKVKATRVLAQDNNGSMRYVTWWDRVIPALEDPNIDMRGLLMAEYPKGLAAHVKVCQQDFNSSTINGFEVHDCAKKKLFKQSLPKNFFKITSTLVLFAGGLVFSGIGVILAHGWFMSEANDNKPKDPQPTSRDHKPLKIKSKNNNSWLFRKKKPDAPIEIHKYKM